MLSLSDVLGGRSSFVPEVVSLLPGLHLAWGTHHHHNRGPGIKRQVIVCARDGGPCQHSTWLGARTIITEGHIITEGQESSVSESCAAIE
eukprot:627257-Pelagomonas_calceolata.AAC.2